MYAIFTLFKSFPLKTYSSTCFKLIAVIPLSTYDYWGFKNLKGSYSTEIVDDISEIADFLFYSDFMKNLLEDAV